MTRALLLCVFWALGSGCREKMVIAPKVEALFLLAQQVRQTLNLKQVERKEAIERFLQLTRTVKTALVNTPRADPRTTVQTINRIVFEKLGFQREVDDQALEWMLLPNVLATSKGNCLGLSTLYLALGTQFDLPLKGVLVPGHFFVRYEGPNGEAINIELLRKGENMARDWYRRKYAPPANNPLYWRPLSFKEVKAVVRFNLANALRGRKRYREALEHYRHVVQVLPDFAEAQGNLGLTYQRLGELQRARQAYTRAQQANPKLEGLQKNLQTVQNELKNRHAAKTAKVP